MDTKNVALVDVSSFMLFEATGDSDAADVDLAAHNAAADDDDDAQSCSCDLLEESERIVEVREFDRHRLKSVVDDDHDDEEEEEEDGEVIDWSGGEEEEEEEEGDEVAMSSTAKDHGHRKKSRTCVDHSAMELRYDEREKSRLFWEACLAS